jgi:hypothetical protein
VEEETEGRGQADREGGRRRREEEERGKWERAGGKGQEERGRRGRRRKEEGERGTKREDLRADNTIVEDRPTPPVFSIYCASSASAPK